MNGRRLLGFRKVSELKMLELIEPGKISKHVKISRVGRFGGVDRDSEGGRLGSFSWISRTCSIRRTR
jgi:hypothetical protein